MRKSALLAGLLLAALPSIASAQHTGFTLFGQPNSDGLNLAPERVAVHPVTSPYFHEDSFITTDLRPWFVYHNFPKSNAIGGGEGYVYALEARVAITDRLQFIANKDGYVELNTGVNDNSGWNDVAAGLKYAVIQDWKNDFHVAVGIGYQFAVGDQSVFQNTQEARGWVSINKGFGKLHLGVVCNYNVLTGNQGPLGGSDYFVVNAHADYWICNWFSPIIEANGYFVANQRNEVVPFSGADIANFGGGDDLVTGAVGFEVRPMTNLAVRAAYETDLTTDADSIFGFRWTFSAVYSF